MGIVAPTRDTLHPASPAILPAQGSFLIRVGILLRNGRQGARAIVLMDQTEWERPTPEGLGGWLILFLLGLWINAAAMLASGVSTFAVLLHLTTAPAFPAPMDPFTAAVAVAAGVYGGVAGYLLARKNPLGPTVARTLLALTSGYSLLALLATHVALRKPTRPGLRDRLLPKCPIRTRCRILCGAASFAGRKCVPLSRQPLKRRDPRRLHRGRRNQTLPRRRKRNRKRRCRRRESPISPNQTAPCNLYRTPIDPIPRNRALQR